MSNLLFSRRALLGGAVSLMIVGGVVGCGGGGSDNNGSGATNANIQFLDTGSTNANTQSFVVSGARDQVNLNTTGVHAGFVEEFDKFHILVLDNRNGLRRILRLEIATDDPRDPTQGVQLSAPDEIGLFYTEREGNRVDFWDATSGSVTITRVTNSSITLNINDARFENLDFPNDGFTLRGTVRLQKDAIVNEDNDVYESHEDGFVSGSSVNRRAPRDHKKTGPYKW